MAAIKLVIAVVKPFKLDNVVDALKGAGVQTMTAFELKDFGQNGPTEIYRGAQYTPNFLPMVRIETRLPRIRSRPLRQRSRRRPTPGGPATSSFS